MTIPTIRTFAALGAALVLSACSMEKNAVQEITAPVSGGLVRFFNFGYGAPTVNFYANDAKVTAITSATGNESTSGVAYGGVGNAGNYSALPPGSYTFAGKITATTDKDLAISSIAGTLVEGNRYSVFQSGAYNTTAKSVDGFIVEDDVPGAFDWTKAYVRFVNASDNSNPMTLNATNTVSGEIIPVGTAITYKSAGSFVAVAPGTYNIAGTCGATCNSTGSGNNTITVSRTALSMTAGRVYTITLRGDVKLNPLTTTLANRLLFDFTANR
ncbi:MAG: DUF4397 domain-containing protein [Gemmatimonadaceae bacterium]|jgi:hypothetical protein